MYFLDKLCRICVQTGPPLVNIDTLDFDSVRLSEKLKICANLVISKDTISSEICEKCVNKLRVSYHFLDMCKKSTKLIQGYLGKLKNTEGNEGDGNNCYHHCLSFESSELNIEIEKLPDVKTENLDWDEELDKVYKDDAILSANVNIRNSISKKKPRITKEQRCSLLKQLLNKPKKERDKSCYSHNIYNYERGGLKNIINFTKNYEFSFNLDKNSNIESTPLDKLTAFSKNYFSRDFSEFKTHILLVIENEHNFKCGSTYGSEDDYYLSESEIDNLSNEENELRFEEVTVEPDIKIKSEISDCEDEDSRCPLDFLETSFEEEEDTKIKNEPNSDSESESESHKATNELSNFYHIKHVTDLSIPQKDLTPNGLSNISATSVNFKSRLGVDSSPAVKLLDRLVSSYPIGSRKIFSPTNVRCRTRDQPYINPMLKNQFLYRSFKCERCNRYFKSQGYLKAHTSKVH